MSDSNPQAVPDELEAAIAANPDEVARFLDRLGLVNDLLETVERTELDGELTRDPAETAGAIGATADAIATPELATLGGTVGENATELSDALDTLLTLQRTGTLDELVAAADTIALVSAAMDDDMVIHLAAAGSRLGELVDTARDEDVAHGLEHVLTALGEAETSEPETPGAVGLVRAMRDPEVRAGLGYVLALSRALGRGRLEGGK